MKLPARRVTARTDPLDFTELGFLDGLDYRVRAAASPTGNSVSSVRRCGQIWHVTGPLVDCLDRSWPVGNHYRLSLVFGDTRSVLD